MHDLPYEVIDVSSQSATAKNCDDHPIAKVNAFRDRDCLYAPANATISASMQAVCSILVYQQLAAGDEFVSRASAQFQRGRFVDVARQDQRRCPDRPKFGAEVGFVHYLEKVREHLNRATIQEHAGPPVHGLLRDGVLGNTEEI